MPQKKLILASASPRRRDLLEMIGVPFEVVPSLYQEPRHSDHLVDPSLFAQEVALEKGLEVFDRLERGRLVLSADTIGIMEDTVLEKPLDREDAFRMMELLSGKTHQVITAVALYRPEIKDPQLEVVTTSVTFRNIKKQEIEQYLNTAEYMDKAAAYAIQGEAAIFVEGIEGDFFNVMGLPVCTVWKMLHQKQR